MTIDDKTKVNITLALTLIGAAVGCSLWITSELAAVKSKNDEAIGVFRNDMSAAINQLKDGFADLKKQVTDVGTDRYTKTQAAEVALRNALRNPGVAFTDPRDPNVAIVVEQGKISRSSAGH